MRLFRSCGVFSAPAEPTPPSSNTSQKPQGGEFYVYFNEILYILIFAIKPVSSTALRSIWKNSNFVVSQISIFKGFSAFKLYFSECFINLYIKYF